MRRKFPWAGLLLVPVLAVSVLAADEKKKDDKKKDDGKSAAAKEDYDVVRRAGEATGRVRNLTAADKSFTLEIDFPVLQPKDNDANLEAQAEHMLRDQQRILSKEQQILTTRDPVMRQLRLQQLYADMSRMAAREQNAYKVVKQHKDFSAQGTDKLQVRLTELPQKFDDKGNPIKYTAQELKDLKGNGPGYAAEFDALQEGQLVKLILARKKKDDPAPDSKLQVATIVIYSDVASDKVDRPGKGEKKK